MGPGGQEGQENPRRERFIENIWNHSIWGKCEKTEDDLAWRPEDQSDVIIIKWGPRAQLLEDSLQSSRPLFLFSTSLIL